MLSVLPPLLPESSNPRALLAVDDAALLDVTDPWHRSRLADDMAKQLRSLVNVVLQIRCDAVHELVHNHGESQARVARHLGVSRARIGQLVAVPTATTEAVTA